MEPKEKSNRINSAVSVERARRAINQAGYMIVFDYNEEPLDRAIEIAYNPSQSFPDGYEDMQQHKDKIEVLFKAAGVRCRFVPKKRSRWVIRFEMKAKAK